MCQATSIPTPSLFSVVDDPDFSIKLHSNSVTSNVCHKFHFRCRAFYKSASRTPTYACTCNLTPTCTPTLQQPQSLRVSGRGLLRRRPSKSLGTFQRIIRKSLRSRTSPAVADAVQQKPWNFADMGGVVRKAPNSPRGVGTGPRAIISPRGLPPLGPKPGPWPVIAP